MRHRDRRPGQFARARARQDYWEHLRARGRGYVLAGAAVYAVAIGLHDLWPAEFNRLFLEAMFILPLWIVSLLVVGRPGVAAWARGADAEEWTAAALRRALGRRYVVLHDIQLGSSNIDHVAVGPGGVFVIETKWSDDRWATRAGQAKIEVARKQVANCVRRVAVALEDAGIGTRPTPVIVLWGGNTRAWNDKKTESNMRHPVPAIAGSSVRTWAATLTADVLDDDQQRAITRVIRSLNVTQLRAKA